MSPRKRMYEFSEILEAAREAIRTQPTVTCDGLRRQLGGGSTQEVQQALRAARWEAGEITGKAEDVLLPQYAVLVQRTSEKSAVEAIDLGAHAPVLRERMDNAMRAALEASQALIEEVRRAAVAQVEAARAEASSQVALVFQREQELVAVVDSVSREMAEAEAAATRDREEMGRSIYELRRDVQEQAAARLNLEGVLESTRCDLHDARSEAKDARSGLVDERRHARNASERHRAELDAVRGEAGAQAAKVAAMEAELDDLRSRLDRAEEATRAATEAASLARERAAAAEAREASLRDGQQWEQRRAS